MLPLRDNIPTSRAPIVTYALIAANVLVYFIWQHGFSLSGPSECQWQEWSAYPSELTGHGDVPLPSQCGTDEAPTYATVFTAMFMHGGLLHLGGNMLFLWIFGNNVEDAMGRLKFLVFYLMGGIAALALHVVTDPGSEVATLGASGAIAGVLGAYAVLFPRARVVTVIFIVFFFTVVETPALIVLGAWFLLQALSASMDQGGGVAYFAHIGGFAWGLLAVRLFASQQRTKRRGERLYSR